MNTKIITLCMLAVILTAGIFGCSRQDPVPVVVTFRGALLDNSLVAQFRNVSGKYLSPVVSLENPTLNHSKRFYIKLGPNEQKEFGWGEGWAFASGERIKIVHDGYRDVEVKVP